MQLVIVESPAKAKTINKYLGSGYDVIASFGHIRDLPSKDGSVEPDNDFSMHWETDARAKERIKEISEKVKKSDGVILATDPDREGEAISWHICEVLRAKKLLGKVPVSRVTFNAITKEAVLTAMKNPREINQELVDAYLARRALDYLVGFSLSPVLWRKLPGARSAGRVQSVALRLVVEREQEIEAFISEEYWSVLADVNKAQSFETRLVSLNGKKLGKHDILNEEMASAASDLIKRSKYTIGSIEAKPIKRHPSPPFTTSTLQQEAARKLHFSTKRTMDIAQKLYEGVDIGGETVGLITYMRTDGVSMDNDAIFSARGVITAKFSEEYVPEKPRFYSVKAKNAQEAHEAIRPTDFKRTPASLKLEGDMAKLYDLIWKRAVASQMQSATIERTTIDLEASDNNSILRANGQVILFDGFLGLYQEGSDEKADDEDAKLPKLNIGDNIDIINVKTIEHHTEPPPRFSEASLVKRMEEIGIGRPSTYASTLSVLQDREYMRLEKNRFSPETKGRLVISFLESFFGKYIEYDFTAQLEEKLDLVSAGSLEYKTLLREFWEDFSKGISDISDIRITQVIDALNEKMSGFLFPKIDGVFNRKCPSCDTGELSLKISRYGSFTGCSNYPECKFTRQLGPDADPESTGSTLTAEGKNLGIEPETGLMISLRSGRFGPYVQLGDDPEKGSKEKPKRASIPKGWNAETLNYDEALKLISLPRIIGNHPEDNEPISANFGRFGPYILHNKTYVNLTDPNEIFEIGINRAVTMIAEKLAGGGRPARSVASALKELGKNAEGADIKLMSGRYGAYVTDGKTNATLPKDISQDALTLEIALGLIEARAAIAPKKATKRTASKTKAPAKASAKPKAAAKPKATTKAKTTKTVKKTAT